MKLPIAVQLLIVFVIVYVILYLGVYLSLLLYNTTITDPSNHAMTIITLGVISAYITVIYYDKFT